MMSLQGKAADAVDFLTSPPLWSESRSRYPSLKGAVCKISGTYCFIRNIEFNCHFMSV